MQTLILVTIGLVTPLFFLLVYAMSSYNKLVTQRRDYQNAYSQIEVKLHRRHDLILFLIQAARESTHYERETLDSVRSACDSASAANARAVAAPGDAVVMDQLKNAEATLSIAVDRVLAGSLPPQANAALTRFREQLAAVEDQLVSACQDFNARVESYNATRTNFPGNVMARTFHLGPAGRCDLPTRSLPLGDASS